MKKPFKKIIMLLLVCMLAAAAPLTVLAARDTEVVPVPPVAAVPISAEAVKSQEGSMETALIAVKNLIDIDDDVYTDFSYSSGYSNYETMEDMVWSFSWSDEKSAYIYAYVTSDGVVLQYRKFFYDEKYFGFAEISKTAAIAAADEFIKKAKPDSFEYYKQPSEITININSNDYSLNYFAEINGYTFSTSQASLNVNKFTGEVTGYSTSNIEPARFKFENADSIISPADAVAAYAGKIGLSLEYRGYYDYESRAYTVYPVYLLDSGGDKYISATTGEVVQFVHDLGVDDMIAYNTGGAGSAPAAMAAADMAMEAESGSGRQALSAAEISALERMSGFITNEQAVQKLIEAAELTDVDLSTFHDKYVNLQRDYMDRDRYFYDIMLYRYNEQLSKDDDVVGIYGRVNAETGRVNSFNISYPAYPYAEVDKSFSEEQAEAAVEEFLKRIAPDELEKSIKESATLSYRGESYYFRYIREVDGIPFRNNGISVALNHYTGKIVNYSLDWIENVEFPGVDGVLTYEHALQVFAEQVGFRTDYITTGQGNAALVYEFKNYSPIDPFTGTALNYNGKPLADRTVTPDYSDVIGHWSEGVVTRLVDNGVYSWGGSFEPGKIMTELEFLQYILLLEYYYSPIDPIPYMEMRGIRIDADADKLLTRQEAARIIVEYLGYGKLAEQSEWFVYPFSDSVADEYKGYVTICYMLGIVNGSNGKFNAAEQITRAQAASMLHNLIIAKS